MTKGLHKSPKVASSSSSSMKPRTTKQPTFFFETPLQMAIKQSEGVFSPFQVWTNTVPGIVKQNEHFGMEQSILQPRSGKTVPISLDIDDRNFFDKSVGPCSLQPLSEGESSPLFPFPNSYETFKARKKGTKSKKSAVGEVLVQGHLRQVIYPTYCLNYKEGRPGFFSVLGSEATFDEDLKKILEPEEILQINPPKKRNKLEALPSKSSSHKLTVGSSPSLTKRVFQKLLNKNIILSEKLKANLENEIISDSSVRNVNRRKTNSSDAFSRQENVRLERENAAELEAFFNMENRSSVHPPHETSYELSVYNESQHIVLPPTYDLPYRTNIAFEARAKAVRDKMRKVDKKNECLSADKIKPKYNRKKCFTGDKQIKKSFQDSEGRARNIYELFRNPLKAKISSSPKEDSYGVISQSKMADDLNLNIIEDNSTSFDSNLDNNKIKASKHPIQNIFTRKRSTEMKLDPTSRLPGINRSDVSQVSFNKTSFKTLSDRELPSSEPEGLDQGTTKVNVDSEKPTVTFISEFLESNVIAPVFQMEHCRDLQWQSASSVIVPESISSEVVEPPKPLSTKHKLIDTCLKLLQSRRKHIIGTSSERQISRIGIGRDGRKQSIYPLRPVTAEGIGDNNNKHCIKYRKIPEAIDDHPTNDEKLFSLEAKKLISSNAFKSYPTNACDTDNIPTSTVSQPLKIREIEKPHSYDMVDVSCQGSGSKMKQYCTIATEPIDFLPQKVNWTEKSVQYSSAHTNLLSTNFSEQDSHENSVSSSGTDSKMKNKTLEARKSSRIRQLLCCCFCSGPIKDDSDRCKIQTHGIDAKHQNCLTKHVDSVKLLRDTRKQFIEQYKRFFYQDSFRNDAQLKTNKQHADKSKLNMVSMNNRVMPQSLSESILTIRG